MASRKDRSVGKSGEGAGGGEVLKNVDGGKMLEDAGDGKLLATRATSELENLVKGIPIDGGRKASRWDAHCRLGPRKAGRASGLALNCHDARGPVRKQEL